MRLHLLMCAAGAALLLEACAVKPDTDHSDQSLTVRDGVDYAWARPSLSTLSAQGYSFAARYASWDTSGKNISAGEAERR